MSTKCTDTKLCETCGTSFPVGGRPPRRKRTTRFCSHKCAAEPKKNRRPCAKCGEPVKPPKKFCSRKCWVDSHNHAHNKTKFVCARCGSDFWRWLSQRQLHATGKVYCSGKCRSEGREYKRGSEHPNYKASGGRTVRMDGYVYVMEREHPKATKDGYVLEHRLVMEKKLGRVLDKHETVHHINGDRADNRSENLQLRSGRHGKGIMHRCVDCGSMNIESIKISDQTYLAGG